MLQSRLTLGTLVMSVTILSAGFVWGQNYPNKPVRIVTSPVGGGNDVAVRLLVPELTALLGQQVIVDNRASGRHSETVVKAQSDGYTLLWDGSYFWNAPLLQKMPYDPVRDFAPISLTNTAPSILVVHPSVPAKSVKELIALTKAKPGSLNYSSGGVGASHHLSAELFKAMAGINVVHIPYTGGGPATNAILGGEVQMLFASGSVLSLVKAGKLRALAVTSAKPSALAPGLPTMAASGVPGYEFENMMGMFAPANTPAAAIKRLNQEIVRALYKDDMKEKFFNAGLDIVGSSPEQFATTIKSDMATMGKVVKDAGIRGE